MSVFLSFSVIERNIHHLDIIKSQDLLIRRVNFHFIDPYLAKQIFKMSFDTHVLM